MATLNETRAPSSRNHLAEQGIIMSNWWKLFQTYWSLSSVFTSEKQPKNLSFHSFSPLRDPLVATFNETGAPKSRKYVAEQTFWLHFFVFALEQLPKILNFLNFFTSKRPFGGYFRWNACTYFHKICSCNAKLIKKISNFLVALFRFGFIKTILKAKFSEFVYHPLVATFKETCALTSSKNVAESIWVFRSYQKHLDYFSRIPPFLRSKISFKNTKFWWLFSLKNPSLETFI